MPSTELERRPAEDGALTRLAFDELGRASPARVTHDAISSAVYSALGAVELRYNTGLHISTNGAALDDLLGVLVEQWSGEVTEIALVGHSMGGLIARSACHCAAADGAPWARLVRHVVSLGSPHFGAPREQGVHRLSHALSRVPETRPVSAFLRRRSAGIRDLRQARSSTPTGPADWLVLQPSGSGSSRSRRIGFDESFGHHVGGANHIVLLNHPAVADKLVEWLSAA